MLSIRPAPWDTAVFGIDCFDISDAHEDALSHAATHTGHYTAKVDPLADKALLHRYGFYYTDTLIEPRCLADRWQPVLDSHASIATDVALDLLLPMCDSSFLHGRFHRDFNLPADRADQRYKQWLGQLHQADDVLGLYYDHKLAGFMACNGGKLLLHTINKEHRGRGLARSLWSCAIDSLFANGTSEVRSSISAANMPVLNLYASLGFRFEKPVDIYHRLTD